MLCSRYSLQIRGLTPSLKVVPCASACRRAQRGQPRAELSRDVVPRVVGGEPYLLWEFQFELQEIGQVDLADSSIGGIKSQHRFSSVDKAHDVDPGADTGFVEAVDRGMSVVAKARVAFGHEFRQGFRLRQSGPDFGIAVYWPVLIIKFDRIANPARQICSAELWKLRAIIAEAGVITESSTLQPANYKGLEAPRGFAGKHAGAADVAWNHGL